MKFNWIDVRKELPKCSRSKRALGVPVLIWPRNASAGRGPDVDGFCYYGKRATGKAAFYLFGSSLDGVTHWSYMPDGPKPKDKL